MKKKSNFVDYPLALVLTRSCSFSASGFEITTHAWSSQKSFERSVLSANHPNSILPVLGFDRLPNSGTFDIQAGLPVTGGDFRFKLFLQFGVCLRSASVIQ
jgi:hypothetical protein